MTKAPATLPPADRHSVFLNAPVGVALCDPLGTLLDVNPALSDLLARPVGDLLGRSLLEFTHPEDRPAAWEACQALNRNRAGRSKLECRLLRQDGETVAVQVATSWVDASPAGEPAHLVMFIDDITDRKTLEARLVHRSLHDPLTSLPNRILYHDRLRHALDRGHREHTPTSVLVIDLDGFKAINDAHGHPMGDQALVAFAERLRSVLRASDTAARLGGDEFSIVCENTGRSDAEVLAERLRRSVREPLRLGEATVRLGMSIGIGLASGGEDPDKAYERVVRQADDAMYADKAHRRR